MSSQKQQEIDEEELLLNEPGAATIDLGEIDEDELLNEGLDTKAFTEEELLFSDDDQERPAPKSELSFSRDDELDYDEEVLNIPELRPEEPQEAPEQVEPSPSDEPEATKDEKQLKPRITAPSPLPEEKSSSSSASIQPLPQRSRLPQVPKVFVNPNFQGRHVIRPVTQVNQMPPLIMRMPMPGSNPVLNVANSIIQSQLANMPNMGGVLRPPRGPVPLMSLHTARQPMFPPRPPMPMPPNLSYMGMPMQPNPQFGGPLTPMVNRMGGPPPHRPPMPPQVSAVGGPGGRQPDWNSDVNQFLMKLNKPGAPAQPVPLLSMMTKDRSRSPRRDRYRRRHRSGRTSRHQRRRSSSRSRSRSRTRSRSSSRSYSRSPSSFSASSRSRSRSRSPRDRHYRNPVNVAPQAARDPGGYVPRNRRSNEGSYRPSDHSRQNQHLDNSIGVDSDYLHKLEEQKRLREQMLKKKEQRRYESRGSPGPSRSSRRDPPPQDPLPTDDKKSGGGGRIGRSKAYLVVVVDNVEKWHAAQPTISAIASATGRIKKCWQSTSSTVSIVFHEHDNAKQFMMNQNGKVYGGCRLNIRLEKAYLNLATV